MREFLSGCVYYPAAGFDGTPVRHLARYWNRFVYVDAHEAKPAALGALVRAPFSGYDLTCQREVSRRELVPGGWSPQPPRWLDRHNYLPTLEPVLSLAQGWASLTKLTRQAHRPESHGPAWFELLQIQAEGAACYQALFNANNVLPAVLVFARAGEGFGGNYSRFRDALLDVMLRHPLGLPPFLFCWHTTGQPEVEEPWHEYYGEKVKGPLEKDGEQYNQISLFVRKGLEGAGPFPPVLSSGAVR